MVERLFRLAARSERKVRTPGLGCTGLSAAQGLD